LKDFFVEVWRPKLSGGSPTSTAVCCLSKINHYAAPEATRRAQPIPCAKKKVTAINPHPPGGIQHNII
jgi:hypothetical protein